MTLLKITHVIQDSKDTGDDYETENTVWDTVGYRTQDIINNGISINGRYCVEYVDEFMYVNLEKLNEAKLKTVKYRFDKTYITYVVLDAKTVVIIGDSDIVKRYKDVEKEDGLSVELTVEEWMIKKLLE